ncbi:hypothetical protein PV328_004899 [Microctonus aethiopoides]|uniref:Exostosin-2 n=2 Tax=Microctonus aethiopoides TaxID=144406 RepID=A0AA39KM42_9HYME|nr:hypothetical protein PV328_004899 [Microctonus aethiopoides]
MIIFGRFIYSIKIVIMTITTGFDKKYHNYGISQSHHRNILLAISIFAMALVVIIIAYQIFTFGNQSEDTIYVPLTLDDVSSSPIIVLNDELPIADKTNSSCSHFGCFNIYRCGMKGNRLLVYVYPPNEFLDSSKKSITSGMSREFLQILQAIITSKFYTADPREACIFIPAIDTLNQNRIKTIGVSQALRNSEFWNGGENHLIFNMVPGSFPDYNTSLDVSLGKAMIAGAGFSTITYRYGFDISIPVFSPLATDLRTRLHEKKSYLIVSAQININTAFEQDLIDIQAASPKDILILRSCSNHKSMTNSIRCVDEKMLKYPDILRSSTFCLVIRGARLGASVLMEALAARCIPVIISDSAIMPFHNVIDWKRAAIFIREVDILTTYSTLKSISSKRIEELSQHGTWLWNKYFKSIEKITKTTFEILTDRVFPQLARDYNYWNIPAASTSFPPLFLPITAPKTHGFTAVILTYDRLELLYSLINKITQVPSLSKILVIWNNKKKNPPASSRWPKLNKPLQVIRTKENILSNRFYPYDEIETEAVLSIDDDIIMLTADELEFAYEVWREFPDRIVGFPSRTHAWDNGTNCWRYESEWTNRISMVLTGAAFHHKYWSYLYTTAMPGGIKEWVDEHMNCEDIAMNFLVANITGKAPIKVTPKKKFRCPECTNTEMLSADLAHMAERTQCINRFSRIYNTMPLKSVEFRADPVLFKDVFPEKLKKFNSIGSL